LILSKLNFDFFEEIRKREDTEILSHFGPAVGKLLIKHAALEDKFQNTCIWDDGAKMIPVDDPFITDEARQIIIDIRATTGKLLRAFSKRENQLLLEKSFNVKSQDFTKFNETITNLERLYESYMTTPLEEVNSVKSQLKQLESKVSDLNNSRDTKKDQLDKHIEECNKSKEVRNVQVTLLAE
jgi:hypothetical protein